MKFREFVGEKKKPKKIVDTSIGKTEYDFLKEVAREDIINETYFGFKLNRKNFKRIFDYIRSWLIRYNIPFDPVNPYLTTHLINNTSTTSNLIKKIKDTKKDIIYKPEGTITIISNNNRVFPRTIGIETKEKLDYIVLNYYVNDYHKTLEDIFYELNIDVLKKLCFVKLFEVESDIVTPVFYEDMMYSAPEIPYVRLGNIGLIKRDKYANI